MNQGLSSWPAALCSLIAFRSRFVKVVYRPAEGAGSPVQTGAFGWAVNDGWESRLIKAGAGFEDLTALDTNPV